MCRFSRDNTLLATGGDDCLIRLFKLDPASGSKKDQEQEVKPVLTIEGHFEPVNCVDISPDGNLLVSTSIDCSSYIYNIDLTSRTKG